MRLTNSLRDEIIDAVVKEALKARVSALQKKEYALADLILDHIWEGHRSAASQFPEGFFSTNTTIRVDKFRRPMPYSGDPGTHFDRYNMLIGSTARLPARYTYSTIELTDVKLVKKVEDFVQELNQLKEDITKLRSSVRQMVYAVSTDTKLFELWPEASKYMPKAEPQMKALVPQREVLNNLIKCVTEDTCNESA